jgi:tetratricopeptide (TPR) repeat protein
MSNIRASRYGTILTAIFLAFACQAVVAQDQCGVERKIQVKGFTNEVVYKRLSRIYEDIGEEKYSTAYPQLQQLIERTKSPYEKAVIEQALAQVAWTLERYSDALRHFETAVQLNSLPNQTHFSLMYQIAQLYTMQERYPQALKALDLWLCKVDPKEITSAVYVLKASIYSHQKNWRDGIIAIDKAIEMDPDPKESWFQMKLGSHFELEQYPEAALTLERMIELWPAKRTYWMQLSQIYIKLKQNKRALAVVALAYKNNLLDREGDYKHLANLYQFLDIPYKAAVVMQAGLESGVVENTRKNWEMTGDAWMSSEEIEEALAAYENAGKDAKDGKIDLRRGYLLTDMEDWARGSEALAMAIRKGGLKDSDVGQAYLLKGMCEYGKGDNKQAREDFGNATRYQRTRSAAQQWIAHMNDERARLASR